VRLAVIAVAAIVVGAACSSGLETPADTLGDREETDSPFGWVLDELPDDYALCAVTTPSPLSLESDAGATLHVYGNLALDDPYEGPLYAVALFPAGPITGLDLGATTEAEVDGDLAFVGGADGLQVATLPDDAGRVLTFSPVESIVAQVIVRNDADIDLVELAEGVVVGGGVATLAPEVLPPGFVDLGDLYQLEGRAQFRFSLDHQAVDETGALADQLTLLGSTGDAASMEAFRFRVPTSNRIDVGGVSGVTADLGVDGGGPWVVSWMPHEGLVLRVFSFRISPPELTAIAAAARRVEGSEWADLQDEFDPSVCAL